jgi:type IV pilus assembly protein PilX
MKQRALLARAARPLLPTQRGVVLVVALAFLLMLTLLSVSMFRSFGLEEKIAGNTREKQRAFTAAESALQYGEWWLLQGNASAGSACAGQLSAAKVCSNALSTTTLSTTSWYAGASNAAGSTYTLPSMSVSTSPAAGTYYAAPQLYISFLGIAPDGQTKLYQVSSIGLGGNPNAVAVVQSTYAVSTGVKDLGGL